MTDARIFKDSEFGKVDYENDVTRSEHNLA